MKYVNRNGILVPDRRVCSFYSSFDTFGHMGANGQVPELAPVFAELDFSAMGDENPWTGDANWQFDLNTAPSAQISSGRWVGVTLNGRQSITAMQTIVDLNARTSIYVKADAAGATGTNICGGIILNNDYTPGAWSGSNAQNGSISGYKLEWRSNLWWLYRMVAGARTQIDTGSLSGQQDILLEVVIGASSNTCTVSIGGVAETPVVDSDAGRTTNFRTFGGSVGGVSGVLSSMSKLSGGTI